MLKNILIVFFTIVSISVFAQDNRGCGTMEHNQNARHQNNDFEKAIAKRVALNINLRANSNEELYTIPVVVHIIHNNSNGSISGNNISEAQVLSQIKVLNDDYGKKSGTNGFNSDQNGADTKIQFCLAQTDPYCRPTTGITRHYYPKDSFDMNTDNTRLKSLGYWPSDKYLNIWVCVLKDGILGYSSFPQNTNLDGLYDPTVSTITDGVVIHTAVFGTINIKKPSFAQGRTATHEIGHWLGLRHVWGDDYCGDDYCNDTRPQDYSTSVNRNCPTLYSYCNGNTYLRNSNNYLDYSADDCMNTFTNDQKARMRAVIELSTARKSVVKNAAFACQRHLSASVPYTQDFNTNNSFLNDGWTITNKDTANTSFTVINNTLELTDNLLPQPKTSTHYFESPYFNFSNINNPIISFNLKSIGSNAVKDTLSIYVATACDGNWTFIKNISFNNINDSLITIFLSQFAQNDRVKIRIQYKLKSNFYGLNLDNIFISEFQEWPFVATDNKMHYYSQNLQNNEKMNVTIYQNNGKKMQEFSFEKSTNLISSHELPLLEPSLYLVIYNKNGIIKKDKFIILSEK